jgi:lipid-A-disaccharide synthase-like uncharacterized protein
MFASLLRFFADPWNMIGTFGQALFASRFILQWLRSEIEGRSVIPVAFWWCSLGGGIILFVYALARNEPVFAVGQVSGLIVYARNLWLVYKEKRIKALTVEIETPKP